MKTVLRLTLMVTLALLAKAATAQTIETIYSFTNSGFTSLRNPYADLVLGPDGNLYGTTQNGGTGGFGTVFRITTTGAITILANLNASTTGGSPYGGVTFGPDGNLYGTTSFAGTCMERQSMAAFMATKEPSSGSQPMVC